jgi:formylmethanofuran dehydrogenase subunit A
MLVRLKGGRIHDPANGVDGALQDLYWRDGKIVAPPTQGERVDETIDARGCVVMAGAIDLHSHIGGGKVNIARAMMTEDHDRYAESATELLRAGCGHAAPSTLSTGYHYATLGYVAAFEPAILPVNARQAHMEMGDTPMLDTGGYAMIGSDDFFLRQLAANDDQEAINDYVAWTLNATQCIGIKVVNPGGISAFKFNQRALSLDEQHVHYGITPRTVVQRLARAVHELGVPHPLHVHASNLGVAGNVDTTLATMEAAEGLPIHLTHIQFHSYGTEGDRKFSSGASRIAEAINQRKNVTADVGQIMFGQTVTASGDSMAQHRNAGYGRPKRSVVMDIECDAGCGVVPFRYQDKNFVNALQWAIGLEIFLRVDDPWRVFLTTDHPNGAPFTSYPHLIRLLMDRTFRNEKLAGIQADAAALSGLASLTREYTLNEIAIMTRAAPARSLGLHDMGHLGVGARAHVVVYRDDANREAMFEKPTHVFKDGTLIAKDGKLVQIVGGGTHTVKPEYDAGIEKKLRDYYARYGTIASDRLKISADELCACGSTGAIVHACTRGRFRL